MKRNEPFIILLLALGFLAIGRAAAEERCYLGDRLQKLRVDLKSTSFEDPDLKKTFERGVTDIGAVIAKIDRSKEGTIEAITISVVRHSDEIIRSVARITASSSDGKKIIKMAQIPESKLFE